MTTASYAHFDLHRHGEIAVARVVSKEIRQPAAAQELGRELDEWLAGVARPRLVINLAHTNYLCSTAFAVLLGVAKRAVAAGGRVVLCDLTPDVAVGANIIALGRVIEVYDDEAAALASF